MPHSPISVANQFLERAGADGLSPMQVLKLTYLAQGWMLGLYQRPITWAEVEAWKYGPVFRGIYSHVAGGGTIRNQLRAYNQERPHFTQIESHILDEVWRVYGKKDGLELSAITHQPGSPWDITYRERGQNSVIPQSLMERYYAAKVA